MALQAAARGAFHDCPAHHTKEHNMSQYGDPRSARPRPEFWAAISLAATIAAGSALMIASAQGAGRAAQASLQAKLTAHPDKIKSCNSANACLQYQNEGPGDAIDGTSSVSGNGNGVYGISNAHGSTGVIGRNFAGGWGLFGQTSGVSGPGAGVAAYSTNGNVALTASVSSANLLKPIFEAYSSSGRVAVIDDAGNIAVTGLLFSSGDCLDGCSRTRRVQTYTPREAAPTTDDVGEAHLAAGRAFVRLDPSFANVIDVKAGYVVLITPEGENRGL
jgi:hypothetical protein